MDYFVGLIAGCLIGGSLIFFLPSYAGGRWEFHRPLVLTGLAILAAGALLLLISLIVL